MTPANDNNERPRSFDDAVMRYYPGLRKLARKLRRDVDEREDLLSQTVMLVLHRWRSYRPDGGMWLWLSLTMRSVNRDMWKVKNRRAGDVELDPANDNARPVMPNHDEIIDANRIVKSMQGRDGEILLRRALGDDLAEIASEHGISRERVRQLSERERKRVLKMVGANA